MKNKTKTIFQYILGSIIIVGFFTLMIVLVYNEIPIKNNDLLNLVVGALIGSFTTIVGYFFGSSSGSAAKDETISSIATSKTNSETNKINPEIVFSSGRLYVTSQNKFKTITIIVITNNHLFCIIYTRNLYLKPFLCYTLYVKNLVLKHKIFSGS